MKPLYLIPEYKKKVWSGQYLEDNIGEYWCVSLREKTSNKIKKEKFNLRDLYENKKINKQIFGNNFLNFERFPLLIKYLSVSTKLSVQVHPDDKYATKYNDYGKMEVWYVIDCDNDARIIYGLKNIDSKGHLLEVLQDNNIQNYFNIVKVKKGDIVPIYPGTIHAIIGNIFIYEIQQNSDLTFRIYDWNRFGNKRPLHIKESFDVIDLKIKKVKKLYNEFNSEKFNFKVHDINKSEIFISRKDSCIILNVIDGNGQLIVDDKKYELNYLDTVLIPASIQKFKTTGNLKIIESWI